MLLVVFFFIFWVEKVACFPTFGCDFENNPKFSYFVNSHKKIINILCKCSSSGNDESMIVWWWWRLDGGSNGNGGNNVNSGGNS